MAKTLLQRITESLAKEGLEPIVRELHKQNVTLYSNVTILDECTIGRNTVLIQRHKGTVWSGDVVEQGRVAVSATSTSYSKHRQVLALVSGR